jgi:hypothetical protein
MRKEESTSETQAHDSSSFDMGWADGADRQLSIRKKKGFSPLFFLSSLLFYFFVFFSSLSFFSSFLFSISLPPPLSPLFFLRAYSHSFTHTLIPSLILSFQYHIPIALLHPPPPTPHSTPLLFLSRSYFTKSKTLTQEQLRPLLH